MPYFLHNGYRIFYDDRGSGQCLLYVHEWNGSSFSFRRINMNRMATGARVVCLDLPGYGHSEFPAGLSFDDLPLVLLGLLDHLGIGECTLAGYCMGAPIALAFNERYPHRVRSLVLIEPVMHFPRILTLLLIPWFGEWVIRYLARSRIFFELLGSRVIGSDPKVREQVFRGIRHVDPHISARYLKLLYQANRRGVAGSLHIVLRDRCLCLTGEASLGLFTDNAKALVRRFRIGSVQTVPESRHFVLVERPEVTEGMILAFLHQEDRGRLPMEHRA